MTPLLIAYKNKTIKGKLTRSGETPTINSLYFFPNEKTHDGSEKHSFCIWLHTEYFIYLTEDVKSQKRCTEKWRNILFKRMIHGLLAVQFMSQQCTVGVFGGVFREGVYQKVINLQPFPG